MYESRTRSVIKKIKARNKRQKKQTPPVSEVIVEDVEKVILQPVALTTGGLNTYTHRIEVVEAPPHVLAFIFDRQEEITGQEEIKEIVFELISCGYLVEVRPYRKEYVSVIEYMAVREGITAEQWIKEHGG